MREIKFRAWNVEEEKFHYVSMLDFINNGYWVQTAQCSGCGFWVYPPDEFILQQFTGLKDINGIDIYEGDIVEGISNNEFSKGMYSDYEIIWGIDSWHVKGTYFSLQELFNYCNNKIKVIGNIYE